MMKFFLIAAAALALSACASTGDIAKPVAKNVPKCKSMMLGGFSDAWCADDPDSYLPSVYLGSRMTGSRGHDVGAE